MPNGRFIVHVDMDAFFASIEERDNPAIKGMPVVIGADPKGGYGRGVVSTCSYEARKFGIHSAQPISMAYRKCPKAVFLPVNIKKYSAESAQIYKILCDFSPDVEAVSIDEAFLNITETFHLFGSPIDTCRGIKNRIKNETGLAASIGLAPTKMCAKIASDIAKPDGLKEIKQAELLDFLHPLKIESIWGIGDKTRRILNDAGIETIGDLAGADALELARLLGKNGPLLWELACGRDAREVKANEEVKSVSNELTFKKDTPDREKVKSTLLYLCEKVSGRLRDDKLKGRIVTLKIRLENFHTYTRAASLCRGTNFVDMIYKKIEELFDSFDTKGKKIRLVGVKVSGLMPKDITDDLFSPVLNIKTENLHQASDMIKRKFGERAIQRAASRINYG
ncbi:MAG: DNA polymerase IV [Candidatus Omnitrophica bacterium CG11_big_fil_rev_8_21_14_0_20_42_13]|uniref:DNA polymerase IV n=1 Tax=Candidatus Ghiorseimicrobium undicola TaxID=1974746 RepID=A0A2H0LX42_9BACT|nr:MAG: DNA polymerase IV [Candidatus Omnitrophica bacterium CG11_big_fil_rev_8_21_14_0_20_42_13]